MASVRWRKYISDNLTAKILALVMAACFWFTIAVEKETVKSFTLPVRIINTPPGLKIGGSQPRSIDVTVAGPAILFLAHPLPRKPVTLDLRKTAKGTVEFPDLGRFVQVPSGVSVIRVFPSSLDLELVER
jgi:hypothetical protein